MICSSFREIQLGAILPYMRWFQTFMSTPIWGRKLDVCFKMGRNPPDFRKRLVMLTWRFQQDRQEYPGPGSLFNHSE